MASRVRLRLWTDGAIQGAAVYLDGVCVGNVARDWRQDQFFVGQPAEPTGWSVYPTLGRPSNGAGLAFGTRRSAVARLVMLAAPGRAGPGDPP